MAGNDRKYQTSAEPESSSSKVHHSPMDEWRTGLCDCFDGDVRICLLASLFPCIIFGQNAQSIDMGKKGTCVWACVLCLVLGPCSSCYGCAYRSKLRGQRGIQGDPFWDFCVYCWCTGCAICQEYRELKYIDSASCLSIPSQQRMSRGTFAYEEMAEASDNFADSSLIGQGGFGHVYKGVLSNNKIVAIKRLKAESRQGEREFQAEIETISDVHHSNLVSLVGYCISGAHRMLVYEFVDNGNLEFHLHKNGSAPLTWSTRMKIAVGAAKGLAYLHEECRPKIIHRDVKASNILLDLTFEPKLSDFGLAKLFFDSDTHVSTRVMGTFGYLSPEYASTGKLTEKSDVYSFGVVLLELITGKKAIISEEIGLVQWSKPLLKEALDEGNLDALVDPKLLKHYKSDEVRRMAGCASACVRQHAQLRPQMSQIVRNLEGSAALEELSEGKSPHFSNIYGSSEIEESDQWNIEAFSSSEYDKTTIAFSTNE